MKTANEEKDPISSMGDLFKIVLDSSSEDYIEPLKPLKNDGIFEPIYFKREIIVDVINHYIDGFYIQDITAMMEMSEEDVHNILNHYLPYL